MWYNEADIPGGCFRENSERGAVGSRRRGHRPHARVTGCTIVMDKALAIVILLVILAIIGLFSIYQKMDRKRLLAEIFFQRNVDREVKGWLADLCAVTAEQETALSGEAARIREQYECLKKSRIGEKTALINQLVEQLEELDEDVSARLDANPVLSARNRELLMAFGDYNRLAAAYNEDLGSNTGKLLAQTFRIKKLPLLREITL